MAENTKDPKMSTILQGEMILTKLELMMCVGKIHTQQKAKCILRLICN